jgi:L-fuconolactonase
MATPTGNMMDTIDSHLHVWEPDRFDYAWLYPSSGRLYRNHSIENALPVLRESRVQGAILVQADASYAETAWLLTIADHHPEVFGVVGWANPYLPTFASEVKSLVRHSKLKGLRLEFPNSDTNLEWEQLYRALSVMKTHQLSCDLLVRHGFNDQLFLTLQMHSDVPFVLNHFGGIELTTETLKSWSPTVLRFSKCPNVYLKVSGFLTASREKPLKSSLLKQFINVARDHFGTHRLLFGSDWPVCTLAGSYSETIQLLSEAIADWSQTEQTQLNYQTAKEVYRVQHTV